MRALALGALTTLVITAYGLRPDAISMGPARTGVVIDADRFWEVQHESRFARRYSSMAVRQGRLEPWGDHGYVCVAPGDMMLPMLYERVDPRLPVEPVTNSISYLRVDAGWPFATLRGEITLAERAETAVTHGILVTQSTDLFGMPMPRARSATPGRGRNDYDAVLPAAPYWPGLLANLTLFSAWWAALIRIPSVILRLVRRCHGRCPDCGYDLRHQWSVGCPECGWNRSASARETRTP